MGTRWKNFREKMKSKEERRKLLRTMFMPEICMVMGMFGIMLLIAVIATGYSTDVTWRVGWIGNLLLAPAVICFTNLWMQKKYGGWQPEESAYYEEWKQAFLKQQKVLLTVFLVLFAVSLYVFNLALDGWRIIYGYGYYIGNLAPYYLMFFTVTVQCALAEITIIRFMWKRLQGYLDGLDEIHRKEMDALGELHQKELDALGETHQKEMEETLEAARKIEEESRTQVSRSERLRMELITNVSHDLKTPLTSMVGYLELLKKEELGDEARDYLEVILRRAEKLKEMIESLFSLAKVSSGNVEMHMEHMTMNRLMEQIFADMEDRIQDSGLEFVRHCTEMDTGMVSDSSYMYRICQNLMENALKYSAQGTRVFVKTYVRVPDEVCLEITNTANYLMDFDTSDIVERFARADASRTTEGNGLGLAIVSTYAKALGGQFDISIDCDQFRARLVFPAEVTSAKEEQEAAESVPKEAEEVPMEPEEMQKQKAEEKEADKKQP